MTHICWVMFGWPNGIVLGNLIASAIWAIPAFLHLHIRMTRHHNQRKENMKGISEILTYLAERVHGLTPEDRQTALDSIAKLAETEVPAAAPAIQEAEKLAVDAMAHEAPAPPPSATA